MSLPTKSRKITNLSESVFKSSTVSLNSSIVQLTRAHLFGFSIAFLEKIRILHSRDQKSSQLSAHKPLLLRSVFVVSLMCKHFDFEKVSQTTPLPDLVSHVMYIK